MNNKVKIERNTVQETLVLPLYGRAWSVRHFPDLFKDRDCLDVLEKLDYDFSLFRKKENTLPARMGSIAAATRQRALVCEISDYLKVHPRAVVVNMGCGLDSAGRQADNGQCSFVNFDLPGVMDLRRQLLPDGPREQSFAADVTDTAWFDRIPFRKEEGAVFFACGVFLYLPKDRVRRLFCSMAERFPGARLTFDAQNPFAARMDLKAGKLAGIMDVKECFSLRDPVSELKSWSPRFRSVKWGRMSTGYVPMDARFGFAYRIMANIADRTKMSQLDTIDFAG